MPKRTETQNINGYTYRVTQMGALRGRKVIGRFVQIAASALGGIVKAEGEATRADAMNSALAGLSDENLEFFFKEFAKDTVVIVPAENADQPDREANLSNDAAFDDIFVDRYVDMFQWMVFCFQVNFGNFLTGVGPLIPSLAAKLGIQLKAKSPSPSPSESTPK